MNYLESIDSEKKKYFNLLEPNIPDWLVEYINTPSLLKQQYISVTCGTYYSDLFPSNIFFSSLDHSIGVALICWHFTHDKKVTLSGLFHDIATPVFKHSIDFMNGDYVNQESTEEKTREIIERDKAIMKLLKRDEITVDEVYDYNIYPIADNDTPRLSSDRFEYSLSNMYFTYQLADFDTIKSIYENVTSGFTNEDGLIELGFESLEQARKFIEIASRLSIIYREDRTIYSMQLLADIMKRLKDEGKITIEDLYDMKESEVIELIKNSKYEDIFNIWVSSQHVCLSDNEPENVYSVNHPSKVRYIDPLVCDSKKYGRASTIDELSKFYIDSNLTYELNQYVYLPGIDFNKKNIQIGIVSAPTFMNQFIEKLKSGELKIETCPQVEVDSELTEEYIIKQLESYQRLLDSGIIDEASEEEQGPVKKLIPNNKK